MLTRRRSFIGLLLLLLLLLAYAVWFIIYSFLALTVIPWGPSFYMPTGPAALILPTLTFVIGVPLYFLPAIIGRRKRNARALFVLNFFLGWTFLGWIGALVWALLRDTAATAPATRGPGKRLLVEDQFDTTNEGETPGPLTDDNLPERVPSRAVDRQGPSHQRPRPGSR